MESKRVLITLMLFLEAFGVLALSQLLFKVTSPALNNNLGFPGMLLSWLMYGIFCMAIAYTVRKKKSGWTLKDLGFTTHRGWIRDIRYGIVIFSILYLIDIPLLAKLLPTHSETLSQQLGFLFEQPFAVSLVMCTVIIFIIGFITGAFHEEIRFRGYLQGFLSRESLPAIGFFVSLIPFSLGHSLSQPDWSFLQVLNTLPGGIVFCLSYYATGSLVVAMTVHTLSDFLPIYAPFLYSWGYSTMSYYLIFGFGVVFVIILILGRADVKHFLNRTKELFVISGLAASLAGVFWGSAFFFLYRELSLFQSRFKLGNTGYYLIVLFVSAVCILASFQVKRNTN